MAWWMLCYVAKPGKEATVAVMVGPFRSRAQALGTQATWLAVNTAHQATLPWYVSDYEDSTGA